MLVTGALDAWALRGWGPERLRSLDVEVPLEMSRGGADYRDAFRDDLPVGKTHAHRERGARAFVAGHLSSMRGFVDTFLARDAKEYDTIAYLAQHDLLSRVPELDEACGEMPLRLIGEDPVEEEEEDETKTRARFAVSRREDARRRNERMDNKTIRRNAWLGPRHGDSSAPRPVPQRFVPGVGHEAVPALPWLGCGAHGRVSQKLPPQEHEPNQIPSVSDRFRRASPKPPRARRRASTCAAAKRCSCPRGRGITSAPSRRASP